MRRENRMDGVEDDVLGRADLHELAGVHDGDVVGHVVEERQLVGDEDHRLDHMVVHELAHHLDDSLLGGDVQGGGGLVGDEDFGIEQGGHGDDRALLHAARELHGEGGEDPGGQVDLLEAVGSHAVDLPVERSPWWTRTTSRMNLPTFLVGLRAFIAAWGM
jgi:hypothetical protein